MEMRARRAGATLIACCMDMFRDERVPWLPSRRDTREGDPPRRRSTVPYENASRPFCATRSSPVKSRFRRAWSASFARA